MAGETILIVEDNEVLRQGLQVLLQAEGYQALTAEHGFDALTKMEGRIPDLILSDIAMPEMDGYAFYDRVRAQAEWISIPFVFLTARRGREEIFTGKRLGAEDYLVKPVSRQELTTTIKSRLARSQQLMLAQLKQAYSSSLIMLANAIELRDQETRGHVERVHQHAMIIAGCMNCSSTEIEQLEYGSILHDIGKIQIPEHVLKKPGPLSDQEWQLMRKHPDIGVEMIRDVKYLSPAIPVIRHHHERWDGSGYPVGLVGKDIPLSARIVAVADSLDAMSSRRPYQSALKLDDAYEEIVRDKGKQYDPLVVEAFIEGWEKIKQSLA